MLNNIKLSVRLHSTKALKINLCRENDTVGRQAALLMTTHGLNRANDNVQIQQRSYTTLMKPNVSMDNIRIIWGFKMFDNHVIKEGNL